MIKEIIQTLLEVKQLNDKYGHISCFDVPNEYDKMEQLRTEAIEKTESVSKTMTDVSATAIYDVCNDIAHEMNWGNINETADSHIYSRESYIETYITESMDDTALRMFESLFYFINSDERGKWLQANYINQEPNEWTDERSYFVIQVSE